MSTGDKLDLYIEVGNWTVVDFMGASNLTKDVTLKDLWKKYSHSNWTHNENSLPVFSENRSHVPNFPQGRSIPNRTFMLTKSKKIKFAYWQKIHWRTK